MVAGPYRAATAEERRARLADLERAARGVWQRGHVPLLALNLGLPMVADLERPLGDQPLDDRQQTLVDELALSLVDRCDAILQIARSPGSDMEVERFRARGARVYRSVEEVPGPE